MPNWTAYVRRHLSVSGLRPERIEEIVEDLARQLEDAYQEALQSGVTPSEAHLRAEQHISDWRALARQLQTSSRERTSAITHWQAEADDRLLTSHGRLTPVAYLRQDLTYGLRTLWRSPGVSAIAILSLALGIGANTAIFSVMNALLLRTLPVRNPQELVVLTDPASSGMLTGVENGSRTFFSFHEFEGLRDRNDVFSGLLAFSSNSLTPPVETDEPNPIRANVLLATGDYFQTLGVGAHYGRVFGPEVDHGLGGHPVAVVSDVFWRTHLRADPSAVGRTIRVRQTAFAVLGVLPPEFTGLVVGERPDLWVPITMQQAVAPGADWLTQPPGVARRVEFLHVVGRLKPGVSLAQANVGANLTFRQDLEAEAALITDADRRKNLLDTYLIAQDMSHGVSELRSEYRQPLGIVMALVGLLLLLACANVANLLLARASGRSRELAVRVALGANRSRLVRQLLTESLLLAAGGAAVGLWLAQLGDQLLLRMVSGDSSPVALDAHLDGAVLAFTLAVTVVTGLLFGLLPAFRATRARPTTVLSGATRDASGSGMGERRRLGKLLAGSQIAISLVLLVTAGLFIRSLQKLTAVPLGYDADGLLMFRVDLSPAGYAQAATGPHFDEMLARFRTVPGVERLSLSANGLFYGGDSGDDVSFPGMPIVAGQDMNARFDCVGPDYFSTLGIPVLVGRDVKPEDATGLQGAWLNQTMARYFFKNQNPVGQHMIVHYSFGDAEYEIRGVTADVRDHSLRGDTARRFYLTFFNNITHPSSTVFQVRYRGDAATVTTGLRGIVQSMDPVVGAPVFRTVQSLIDLQLLRDRMTAELSGVFGVFALLLASIGLYGVLSYQVSRRLGEIGVRMALGADRPRILGLILREAALVSVVGALVGLAVALTATRWLGTLLFGLTGRDPATLALATGVLLSVAMMAAFRPAWRASRTDPIAVLRGE